MIFLILLQTTDKIKRLVDLNIFFKIYSKVQGELDREKGDRKRKEKQNMVTNPDKLDFNIIFFLSLFIKSNEFFFMYTL